MSDAALKTNLLDGLRSDPRVARLRAVLGAEVDRCHLVGGAVRDFALGLIPLELDVVVEGDAIGLATSLCPEVLETHDRFLTATCQFEWGSVDFASARSEVYPKPGALPDVLPAGIELDLRRRDFTINGLTVPLTATEADEWPAVEGGWEDLEAGIVRVIHDRSFVDDPTRLWRAARYCGRLGMRLDRDTALLAHQAVTAGVFETVSAPRIGAELLRTTDSAESLGALETAQELGLLSSVGGSGLDFSRLAAAAAILGTDEAPQMLRLAALWWKETSAVQSAQAMNLDSRLTGLAAQCAMGGLLEQALAAASRPSEIRVACAGWLPESIAVAGATSGFDKARLWLDQLSHVTLPIDGSDLAAAGLAEGPIVGVALESALDHLLDHGSASREELISISLATAQELGWSA